MTQTIKHINQTIDKFYRGGEYVYYQYVTLINSLFYKINLRNLVTQFIINNLCTTQRDCTSIFARNNLPIHLR